MPWTSEHLKWLVDTGERITTADGKTVEVWEFRHENDDEVGQSIFGITIAWIAILISCERRNHGRIISTTPNSPARQQT